MDSTLPILFAIGIAATLILFKFASISEEERQNSLKTYCVCPRCGSKRAVLRQFHDSLVCERQALQCSGCGCHAIRDILRTDFDRDRPPEPWRERYSGTEIELDPKLLSGPM